jgi:hypothetical protein
MKKLFFVLLAIMIAQYFLKNRQTRSLEARLLTNQRLIDSLKSELFTSDLQLNRYQMTLEKMRENDSTCTMLFEAIMEQETE